MNVVLPFGADVSFRPAKGRGMVAHNTDARSRIRQFREPFMLAMVSRVMLSHILPRNMWAGLRTRDTMASQAAWADANRRGGLLMLAVSGLWILAAVSLARPYVLHEVITTLRPLAEAKRLTLEARIPPDGAILQTDGRALRQVLLNLTNNAIKFTDVGRVLLELIPPELEGLKIEIRVTDTGRANPRAPARQSRLASTRT